MCKGRLEADEVVNVHDGMEAVPPHKRSNHPCDVDAGHAGGPAAEGQCDVDVAPPVDEDAEEGLGEGVSPELAVGTGDIGAPKVGPLALFNEALPEVSDTGEPVGVGYAEVFPPGNTAVHTRARGK